ncbi:MAG: 30S ribosomal protein S19e [Sulfolobales archaeon]|nr:30S ribosomal protein S19e [Sulfolobales archaeon]
MGCSRVVDVREVPADAFIKHLANYLKSNVSVLRPPTWSSYVKTGHFKTGVPENPDWWYFRAASILRKLYVNGSPVGVGAFRVMYGGLKRRGSAPPHFREAASSNIRHILQQLEAAGYVAKVRGRGRVLTPKGMSLLTRVASEVSQESVKLIPRLAKYS